MSLTLGTSNSTQPLFRLTLKRFVFAGENRVVYASDESEARRILDSGL